MPVPFNRTVAYDQIVAYVNSNLNTEELTVMEVCQKALQNLYDQRRDISLNTDLDVDVMFIWDDTPEGHHFWQSVQTYYDELDAEEPYALEV